MNRKNGYKNTKWAILAGVFVILWLVVGTIGGPAFGKLSDVANNNQQSFLPASADSTKVQNLLPKFQQSESIPAVIVIKTPKPLNNKELVRYASLLHAIHNVPGVAKGKDSIIGPILSSDRQAIEIIAQISSNNNASNVVSNLQKAIDSKLPSGAKAYVTGPAGLGAALVNAFKGIDGTLLYVALGAVLIILLLVYRSIILPFLVLFTAGMAMSAAGFAVYHGVKANWFDLNGQSQGILSILVIGAATDYSLLLTARFREALEINESKWAAMRQAFRGSVEPILAAGITVILALLSLLFSNLNSNRSLGPIAGFGILFSILAGLTFLPAILVLLGRKAYWPLVPKTSSKQINKDIKTGLENRQGLWKTVPSFVQAKHRLIWIVIVIILSIAALFVPTFKSNGVSETATILGKSAAVAGQNVLAEHFPAGSGSPILIITTKTQLENVVNTMKSTSNIIQRSITVSKSNTAGENRLLITATLSKQADGEAAIQTVAQLRKSFSKTAPSTLIGGTTAIQLDTNTTSRNDLIKIVPIVLTVILIILIILLRSFLAPLVLIGSVILSYTATIGISSILFNHLFHFPGSDAAIPLFGFIFLVALGVDYNIFLMTRVREESLNHGTRPGVLRGLSLTGSVITSAGIVLASTFAALAVVPVLFLIQIAFIVAFGVLLDTIIVRSLLVPALVYDIGHKIWWPNNKKIS